MDLLCSGWGAWPGRVSLLNNYCFFGLLCLPYPSLKFVHTFLL